MLLTWELDSSPKKGLRHRLHLFLNESYNMSQKKSPTKIENGFNIKLMFSYRAKTNDELTFPDMAIMNLVETSYDGWPVVEYNGKQGKVPAVLLEPYKTQEFLKQDK